MKKVLVLEDDQDLQIIYKDALSDAGFDVVVADDAEQAFGRMDPKPDVILLDIMLPGKMNGLEFLQKVKSQEETKDIAVVIITNLDSEEKEAISLGAVEYLIKANNPPDKVVDAVKKHSSKGVFGFIKKS